MIAYLSRHAQSESNAGLVTAHPNAARLTALGADQSVVLGNYLPPAKRVVTSSYVRTPLTAAPFLRRFPHVVSVVWPVHEFTYLNPRHYGQTTHAERVPASNIYWDRNDPAYRDGGEAESLIDLFDRVRGTLDRLEDDPPPHVFTHGDFIRATLWCTLEGFHASPSTMKAFRKFRADTRVPNASIVQLYRLGAYGSWRPGLVMTNHLPENLLTE